QRRGELVPQELLKRLCESLKRCSCWWCSFRIRSTEGRSISNRPSQRQSFGGADIIPNSNGIFTTFSLGGH
ncbi:unnamed protein product, partial [Brassica rapa subsp. trilocularis]